MSGTEWREARDKEHRERERVYGGETKGRGRVAVLSPIARFMVWNIEVN